MYYGLRLGVSCYLLSIVGLIQLIFVEGKLQAIDYYKLITWHESRAQFQN